MMNKTTTAKATATVTTKGNAIKVAGATVTPKEIKKAIKKVTKVTKARKALTKKQKAERKAKFLVSGYNVEVNQVNKRIKNYSKSLGGVRALILHTKDMSKATKVVIDILEATKGNSAKHKSAYKVLQSYVKPSKAGNFGTYAVLRTLRKNATAMKTAMKLK